MSNYTNGPWTVEPGYYPGFIEIRGASFTPSIVTCATDLSFEDFLARTADAHLMAAAPELLEALVIAEGALREICTVRNIPMPESTISRAQAAIAKARGLK